MSTLKQDIKNIIDRSRHCEERLLYDTEAASLEIILLVEKRMKEINKIVPPVKDVEY